MTEVSIPGVAASDIAAGRRPRNRRETIGKVAAVLFAEQGFEAARMDDIAAASGITVRALYRHFANKGALLTEIMETSQTRFLSAVGGVEEHVAMPERFGEAVERLALASEDTAHFAVLWQRESRHLDTANFDRLRSRLLGMVAALADMAGAAAPELNPFQRELRAWAAISAFVVPRTETDVATATAAAHALLDNASAMSLRAAPVDAAAIAADETVSRRERLLASATDRFAQAGFAGTGIDDIGRPAGVSGPSLYRHFGSKSEILDTLAERRASWLWHDATVRWCANATPDDRLDELTAAFVCTAVRFPQLVGIWVTEGSHVAENVRSAVSTSLDSFHATWSSALQAVRPDLTPATSTRMVAIVVQVVEDCVRIRHLAAHPGFASELAGTVRTIMDGAQPEG